MQRIALFSVFMAVAACTAPPADTDGSQRNDPASWNAEGQALSSACSGCHAIGGSAIADLSSWSKDAISTRMTAYKNDTKGTTVMHRLARGYSTAEIEDIAAYIAETSQAKP